MEAGDRLRELRVRRGMSVRDVAYLSSLMAKEKGNVDFCISGPWLTQMENKSVMPSIFKLFSLAVVYGVSFSDLLSYYGMELDQIASYHGRLPVRKTHIAEFGLSELPRSVSLPVRFDLGFTLSKTTLFSRLVAAWGDVPLELLPALDFRKETYGFIGTEDHTMEPLIRAGSFVQIDTESRSPHSRQFSSEFDRPIYFVKLDTEYAFGWCELQNDLLVLIGHPLSACVTRFFRMPLEAVIIGEVRGVAMRLGPLASSRPEEPARAQMQS